MRDRWRGERGGGEKDSERERGRVYGARKDRRPMGWWRGNGRSRMARNCGGNAPTFISDIIDSDESRCVKFDNKMMDEREKPLVYTN